MSKTVSEANVLLKPNMFLKPAVYIYFHEKMPTKPFITVKNKHPKMYLIYSPYFSILAMTFFMLDQTQLICCLSDACWTLFRGLEGMKVKNKMKNSKILHVK